MLEPKEVSSSDHERLSLRTSARSPDRRLPERLGGQLVRRLLGVGDRGAEGAGELVTIFSEDDRRVIPVHRDNLETPANLAIPSVTGTRFTIDVVDLRGAKQDRAPRPRLRPVSRLRPSEVPRQVRVAERKRDRFTAGA